MEKLLTKSKKRVVCERINGDTVEVNGKRITRDMDNDWTSEEQFSLDEAHYFRQFIRVMSAKLPRMTFKK